MCSVVGAGASGRRKGERLLLALFFVQTSGMRLRQEEEALRLREETFVTLCFVVRKKTFGLRTRSKNVASGKSVVSG